MTRQEDLGAQLDHLAEGRRPFAREALDLLRIPAVGRSPDEKVPATQHAMFRHPGPGVVVRFALGVVQLEIDPAHLEVESICICAVGIPVVGRPCESRCLELPGVDDAVVTRRQHVAVEARRKCFVGDDDGRAPASLLGFVFEHRHAENVVYVAVGVDGGVEPVGRPAAYLFVDGRRHQRRPGVYEDEPVIGLERRDIRERRNERHPVQHLSEISPVADGMYGGGDRLAFPKSVGEGDDVVRTIAASYAHAHSRSAERRSA